MYRKPVRNRFAPGVAWSLCALSSALLAGAIVPDAHADRKKPPVAGESTVPKPPSARPLTETERIVHVLNRLGFGPRPGDVDKVRAMGLQAYINQQLNPERISDPVVEAKLATFAELQLSDEQISAIYHDFIQAERSGIGLKKQIKKQNGAKGEAMPATTANAMPADADNPASMQDAAPPATQAKKAAKSAMLMDADTRRSVQDARQELARAGLPVARLHAQFMAAKALRAVESERQLQEVLVDFWGNHFNIDLRKAPCGVLKIVDDRAVIRPHILGKFRDLLGASAHSPAMLVYLDNYQSTADETNAPTPARRRLKLAQIAAEASNPPQANGPQPNGATPAAVPPKPKKKRVGGLNENYAREIMELHTLGVDGGYTQDDVREVARCFTGWSIGKQGGARRPAQGKYADAGAFKFYPNLHDNGEKKVLGHVIPANGGERDGELVLDILASHPATMRHISTQLCQRFVADEPPTTLVDKCVVTWKRTDGDLREIVRTIVTSGEFYAPSVVRGKIKSPFEYAVSAVRALGGSYDVTVAAPERVLPRQAVSLIKPPKGGGYLDLNATSLVGQVGTMGQPLFQYQAPTGYPEEGRRWVSSGALISRPNYALALTEGKIGDVKTSPLPLADGADTTRQLDQAAQQILYVSLAPATRATLLKQASSKGANAASSAEPLTSARIAALLLGSPEFQRR